MGNGRGTDTAWGLGLERKGFLEAGDRGDNAPHGSPYRQGEGSESERELGFMERQLQGYGRDRDGDRSQGTAAGGWEAGSNHSQAGKLGSSLEGKESRKGNGSHLGRHGQDQAGIRKRALRGSQADPEGSWLKQEGKEMFQDSREDEMEGEHGLRTERGGGTTRERCGSAVSLGEAGGSSSSELLGGRGSSNQAGMSPESCGSQGGREDGHGKARVYWELGECPGQTSGNRNLLGSRGLEVTGKGSLPGADQQGAGTVGGERSYTTGPGGPGDLREWEDGLQGIQGKYGQDTGGALGRTGVGSPNLQSPQSWAAQQKGPGDPSRIESESTGPWDDSWSSLRGTGTHFGTRMRPPGGEKSMDNAQVDAAMESGQGREARSYGLVRSSGLGTPRSDGTLGDREDIRDPGAVGSGLDFWNGTGSSRGEGFRGETSHQRGLGGPGGVESVYGDGKGYSRGTGPGNGAYYGDGSVLPGEAGSAHGVGGRVSSGASVGAGSEEGSAYRHGSGVLGEMWSRNKDHHSSVGRGSGIVAGDENGLGGPEGVPMEGARMWDASRGWGPAGPGRGHCPGDDVGSPGTVGSAGRDGLEAYGTAEMAGQGHVGAEPGASGRIKSWGQTRGDGDSRASGALGSSGKGGWEDGTGSPGAMDPGSLRVRGKETEGHGAWTSGAGTVYGDHSRPPAPYTGAGSESEWVHGSGEGVCYRDGSEVPAPQGPGDRRLYGGGPRSLGLGRTGPKGEGGISNGPEGLQGMGLAGEAAQGSGTGGSGTIPAGSEAGYRGGLEHPGGVLSRNEMDVQGGTGIAGGRGSEREFGHKGGSGRSGETEGGLHYGDGTGKIGGAGSLARMKHEADPRDRKMVEPESGYWAASVGPTSSQGGPEKSRGMGFADGTGAGVGSGVAGMLGAADGAARGDSSVGPGWGTTSSHEGYGTSGIHEAFGAMSSRGSGIPGAPRDSGTARGEDGSAGQAGTLGSSSLLDGRGAAEGEARAGIAAPESEQKRNFKEAGSGPTHRSRVASQGGLAPQDAGDSLLGDRRMGAGSGSTPRAGQIVDSSSIPGGSSKSVSGPDEVQGMSHAWAPGWEDQGFPGGSTGAVNQLSGSSSLQKNDSSFRGTSKGPGGSGGGGDAEQALEEDQEEFRAHIPI
ncbi:immunoglobulin-like and fibronectin type III domain-containing protein 1 [Dipodomys merriami]|uniref:immunoglobulin-like and fibronectin type III domain-containing protein 1 n=1 Tax=Dipodomys merriami TaxID=94247 RepID=UPI003855E17B